MVWYIVVLLHWAQWNAFPGPGFGLDTRRRSLPLTVDIRYIASYHYNKETHSGNEMKLPFDDREQFAPCPGQFALLWPAKSDTAGTYTPRRTGGEPWASV